MISCKVGLPLSPNFIYKWSIIKKIPSANSLHLTSCAIHTCLLDIRFAWWYANVCIFLSDDFHIIKSAPLLINCISDLSSPLPWLFVPRHTLHPLYLFCLLQPTWQRPPAIRTLLYHSLLCQFLHIGCASQLVWGKVQKHFSNKIQLSFDLIEFNDSYLHTRAS